MNKKQVIVLALLLLTAIVLYAQAIAPVPGQPLTRLPWWAYPLAVAGINVGLLGLQKVAPKIPAALVPLASMGLGMGFSYLGLQSPDFSTIFTTGVAVAGGASLVHNTIKNAVRGDDFGTPSVPVQ